MLDDPSAYPPDVLVDDGLALIDGLGLDDYDLGGCSLGARIVLRMLVRGARPRRVIVVAQGLHASTRDQTAGGYRRVLTALAKGDPIEPGSPEAEQAHWITLLGGRPQALLHVLDSLVPTPESLLHKIDTPTLVAVGDRDPAHDSAADLAEVLPCGEFTQVPGDHFTALWSAELRSAMVDFLNR